MGRIMDALGIRGTIRNHSSKVLWVVESTNKPPKDFIGWITKKEAIKLARRGEIDNVVIVNSKKHGSYLRSKPDHDKDNNLSSLV